MAKMTMAKAMKKWEGSKADKAMDKKMGLREGSKKDMRIDKQGARKIMKRMSVRSAAQQSFGGRY